VYVQYVPVLAQTVKNMVDRFEIIEVFLKGILVRFCVFCQWVIWSKFWNKKWDEDIIYFPKPLKLFLKLKSTSDNITSTTTEANSILNKYVQVICKPKLSARLSQAAPPILLLLDRQDIEP